MKKVNRYEIRRYTDSSKFSKMIGHKGRLLTYKDAVKVTRRLKKSGVDVFYAKLEILV